MNIEKTDTDFQLHAFFKYKKVQFVHKGVATHANNTKQYFATLKSVIHVQFVHVHHMQTANNPFGTHNSIQFNIGEKNINGRECFVLLGMRFCRLF